MRKCFKAMAVSAVLTAALVVPAGASSFDHCADKLKDLGLFQGTSDGYALDRAPTRAEAATMLVRMLGKEDEAKALQYTAPFTDLQGWEEPYVQYLYDNGLTSGMTATTFAPGQACSSQMYTTFLLRALGYSDADGDFTYNDSIQYAQDLGLADAANIGSGEFLRDNVVAMSYTALNTQVKGSEDTNLLTKLAADGAIDQTKAADAQKIFDAYDQYVAASKEMNGSDRLDMSAEVKANVSMDGQKVIDMTMPLNIKMIVDTQTPSNSKIAMTGTVKMNLDQSLVAETDPNSVNTTIEYYYTDGIYYMNMGDQKIKMAMPLDDMLDQVEGIMQTGKTTEPISLIESISQSGNDITITYSSGGLDAMVNSVLKSMNLDTVMGQLELNIDDMTSSVTLSQGQVSKMDVSMKMSMTAEGQTMGMDMSMNCKINALGGTVGITFPDDLDTYKDSSQLN